MDADTQATINRPKRRKPRRNDDATRNALATQWADLPAWCWEHLEQVEIKQQPLADPVIDAVRRLGRDDAVAEGALGLLRAAELWDSTGDVQFNTFAVPWIVKQMVHATGIHKRGYADEALTSNFTDVAVFAGGELDEEGEPIPFNPLDGEGGSPLNLGATDDVFVGASVQKILKRLKSERARRVVWERVVNGRTFAEIGESEGVTQQAASAWYRRSIRRLRAAGMGNRKGKGRRRRVAVVGVAS